MPGIPLVLFLMPSRNYFWQYLSFVHPPVFFLISIILF